MSTRDVIELEERVSVGYGRAHLDYLKNYRADYRCYEYDVGQARDI